jgi:L-malate glycosyltransferase
MRERFYRCILRIGMAGYLCVLRTAIYLVPKRNLAPRIEYNILLTGTFYSKNWLSPHLQPLAGANVCKRVRVVSTSTVPDIPKVEGVYPPYWLIKLIGDVPARLSLFIWLVLKDRPQVVGGFHLQFNGLLSILLARMVGARSLYICGGGEREVEGGGYLTETKLFRQLGRADFFLEQQLLAAVRYCDLVIVMGRGGKNFFTNHGVPGAIHIMPGGFDEVRFSPSRTPPEADLITIGRLSMVKRVDVLLETISLLRQNFPSISTVIVGDGPDKKSLEQYSGELGIVDLVDFVGHQENVEQWLGKAKIFVLCSDSEGVSQAMIQAMLCGLPVVVSNVGDLADLVVDGVNGFLVSERTPENFANRIGVLLNNPKLLDRMSQEARKTGELYGIEFSSRRWDAILTEEIHMKADGKASAEQVEGVR